MVQRIFAWAKGYELAEDLIAGQAAGLLHLRTLSEIVGRKIRVWDSKGQILGVYEGRLISINEIDELNKSSLSYYRNNFVKESFGPTFENESYLEKENNLDLEYHNSDEGGVGHWIKKNGRTTRGEGNNCLFEAICQELLNCEPTILRKIAAEVIREKGLIVEEGFSQFSGLGVFLLGGAKYDGTDPSHARQILDNSQGSRGHGHVARAHPRGHASHPSATGDIDCVENYSLSSQKNFPKSAWLSRQDQDEAMHLLLMTNDVQSAMNDLNNGETRKVVKLIPNFRIRMGLWAEGTMFSGPHYAESVTILLQHRSGKFQDINADVQIFTCYPVNNEAIRNPKLSTAVYSITSIDNTDRLPLSDTSFLSEGNKNKRRKISLD